MRKLETKEQWEKKEGKKERKEKKEKERREGRREGRKRKRSCIAAIPFLSRKWFELLLVLTFNLFPLPTFFLPFKILAESSFLRG